MFFQGLRNNKRFVVCQRLRLQGKGNGPREEQRKMKISEMKWLSQALTTGTRHCRLPAWARGSGRCIVSPSGCATSKHSAPNSALQQCPPPPVSFRPRGTLCLPSRLSAGLCPSVVLRQGLEGRSQLLGFHGIRDSRDFDNLDQSFSKGVAPVRLC